MRAWECLGIPKTRQSPHAFFPIILVPASSCSTGGDGQPTSGQVLAAPSDERGQPRFCTHIQSRTARYRCACVMRALRVCCSIARHCVLAPPHPGVHIHILLPHTPAQAAFDFYGVGHRSMTWASLLFPGTFFAALWPPALGHAPASACLLPHLPPTTSHSRPSIKWMSLLSYITGVHHQHAATFAWNSLVWRHDHDKVKRDLDRLAAYMQARTVSHCAPLPVHCSPAHAPTRPQSLQIRREQAVSLPHFVVELTPGNKLTPG